MREYQIRFRPEQIATDAFLASTATVLGDVTIGDGSSIWFGAVIRGDTELIAIGARTNIQDGAILHADPGIPCRIGDDVTVGHGAIIHGAEIGNGVLVGMRATILNNAKIGPGSLIAAGALITEGTEIPPNSVVMGAPGRIVRQTTEQDRLRLVQGALHYVEAAAAYRANVRGAESA